MTMVSVHFSKDSRPGSMLEVIPVGRCKLYRGDCWHSLCNQIYQSAEHSSWPLIICAVKKFTFDLLSTKTHIHIKFRWLQHCMKVSELCLQWCCNSVHSEQNCLIRYDLCFSKRKTRCNSANSIPLGGPW